MRAYNFCAGPAALPTAVLERAQTELADWHGRGLSIMEMSHRSDDFVGVAEKAEADLRKLLDIPSNYKVLFLQGGASLQFSAIPLNLLGAGQTADYIDTGIWSQKAIEEARRFGGTRQAWWRGGVRTLVATSKGNRWFFVFGFEKNERANISDEEYDALEAKLRAAERTHAQPHAHDMDTDALASLADVLRGG